MGDLFSSDKELKKPLCVSVGLSVGLSVRDIVEFLALLHSSCSDQAVFTAVSQLSLSFLSAVSQQSLSSLSAVSQHSLSTLSAVSQQSLSTL